MAVRFKDNTKEFNRRLRRATSVGLKRAAIFYRTKAREAVSIWAGPVRRERVRTGPAGSRSIHWTNPSKPGEAPHLRTGTGRANIIWEHNGNEKNPAVRIGSTKAGMHLIWLELDIKHTDGQPEASPSKSKIGSRPWLLATLRKHWDQISMLAVTGGKRHIG